MPELLAQQSNDFFMKDHQAIVNPVMSHQLLAVLMLALGVLTSLMACRRESEISMESLYGRWDIARAERNMKETHYLDGGYFDFRPDGQMIVNLTGAEENGAYILEGSVIEMEDGRQFEVKKLQQDSLFIRFNPSAESQFHIVLIKDHGRPQ